MVSSRAAAVSATVSNDRPPVPADLAANATEDASPDIIQHFHRYNKQKTGLMESDNMTVYSAY